MAISKSCRNCELRHSQFDEKATCMLSGLYCRAERRNPTKCGRNFSGWKLRNVGFFGKLIRMFFIIEDK